MSRTLGSQYDGADRTRDWWTEEDAREFGDRMQCISHDASTYTYASCAPGINMAMRNSPAFAKAFNCQPGDPMVKPDTEVCHTW